MWQKLLDFDPLKWTDDAVAILRNGWGRKIEWYKASGWTGAKVEGILRRYGISVYARDYGHGKMTKGLRVRRQQAAWADYVLRKAGCPLASPPLSNAQPGDLPKEWGVPARPIGVAGRIGEIFMWLGGEK